MKRPDAFLLEKPVGEARSRLAHAVQLKLSNDALNDRAQEPESLVQGVGEPLVRSDQPLSRELRDLYVEGRVGIRLDLITQHVWRDLEPGYFCLAIDKDERVHVIEGDAHGAAGPDHRGTTGDVAAHYVQLTVPVYPGQLIDPIEGGEARIIPSRVRLYRFDPLPVLLAQWVDATVIAPEGHRIVVDRKHDGVVVWRRVLAAIHDGDSVGAVVEGGAEVVEGLAQANSYRGRHAPMLLEPQPAMPFIVAVENGAVRVLIHEGAPAPECGISVGSRPPQSVPAAIKWVRGHA